MVTGQELAGAALPGIRAFVAPQAFVDGRRFVDLLWAMGL